MTASSAEPGYPAHFGRREYKSAWCANKSLLQDPVNAKSQYLQIDFLNLKRILAVRTFGLNSNSFVTNYYVYYAVDSRAFHSLRHGERSEKMVSTHQREYSILLAPVVQRADNVIQWISHCPSGTNVLQTTLLESFLHNPILN